jgi:enterochelin esterase-like enzyme
MKSVLSILLLFISFISTSQKLGSIVNEFRLIGNLTNKTARLVEYERALKKVQGKFPLIEKDSVLFLYRGNAESVIWMGDFNGWGRDQEFNNKGIKIDSLDLWYLKARFPEDARLDYKLVINGKDWILDPENKAEQWGGAGPNSVVYMPAFKKDNFDRPVMKEMAGIVSDNQLLQSSTLGSRLQYSVYLPNNYSSKKKYPSIYVTDGQEYADQKLGSMIQILDNLILLGRIKPVIAVFISPVNPEDKQNKRMDQYTLNEAFLKVISEELVPRIDSLYSTEKESRSRAIMGTSLGGLNSAYFVFKRPDVFGMAGIHSPAYWYKPDIFQIAESSEIMPFRVFMSTGVIMDGEKESRKMKQILEKKRVNLVYKEVNEGHSWGNWRNLTDDLLVALFGNN